MLKKKLFILIVLVQAVSLLLSLIPQPKANAQAQTTGQWLNPSQITVSGVVYKDARADFYVENEINYISFVFWQDGNKSDCGANILTDFNDAGTQAKLYTQKSTTKPAYPTGCEPANIISNVPLSPPSFNGDWKNESSITVNDGPFAGNYVDSKSDSDTTYYKNNVQPDNGVCPEKIVNVSGNKQSARLQVNRWVQLGRQGGCINSLMPAANLALGATQNANAQYFWGDNINSIKRSDGSETFRHTDTNAPGIYSKVGDDPCADYMVPALGGATTIPTTVIDATLNIQENIAQGTRGTPAEPECRVQSRVTVQISPNQTPSIDPSNPVDGTGNGQQDSSCESRQGVMAWIMCPAVLLIESSLNWLNTQIQAMLEVDRSVYADGKIKDAWQNIRNVAYIILIPIMLVMVIGTALDFNFVDAYTVRKALPRFAIAVVFIALSYYVGVFLIELFNRIGYGVYGLMTAPFTNNGVELTFSSLYDGSVLTGVLSGAGLAVGAVLAVWLFGGTLLLAVAIAFLVLLLRQMFIVALLLVAPLAILAWIFPGQDRLWKLWWDTFTKLLIMFPLIMALIAIGSIFAWTFDNAMGGGGLSGPLRSIMVLIAFIIPYALIPLTFRFAGGMFATITGMINDRSKGLFDRQKQGRANKIQRTSTGNLFKNAPESGLRLRSRFNTLGATAMNINKAGINPRRMRTRMQSELSKNAMLEAAEAREKNTDLQAVFGNDDYLEAGRTSRERNADGSARDGSERAIRQYLSERGYEGRTLEQGVAAVRAAQRGMSQKAFDIAAVAGITGSGTGFRDGAGEMYAAINDVAGDDRNMAARMYAEARGIAERARRPDLIGGGFVGGLNVLNDQYNAGDTEASQQASSEAVDTLALQSQDPRLLLAAKPASVRRLAPRVIDDFTGALQRRDAGAAVQAGAQLAVMRNQLASYPQEIRDEISARLTDAGIDLGAEHSVDEQLGTLIGSVSGRSEQELTQEIRTRAGLYDTGYRGAVPPELRGTAADTTPTDDQPR